MPIKSGRVLTFFLLLGNLAAGRAETVELTGVASFFGQKMALLTICQSAQAKPVNVTLSEGETSDGIQLVAIDFPLRNVQILNAGERQTLHICSSATATGPATAARVTANGITIFHADGTYEFQATVPVNTAGDASLEIPPLGAVSSVEKSADSSAPPDTDAYSNDDSSQTPKQTKTYQWWVQEAEKIERARNETAARVKAGEWQPYPRTPLTPANTPAELVSADEAFMDHGPGVVIPGN